MPNRYAIHAGTVLEIPTIEDIIDPISGMLKSLGKNARFIRHINTTLASATGAWSLNFTVPQGFMWMVTTVTVDPGNTTGTWQGYVNSVTPINLVLNTQTGNVVYAYGKSQCILKSDDTLILNSVAAAVNNYSVGAMVQAIEVPIGHEAQLLI